jgi:hypothetical protein
MLKTIPAVIRFMKASLLRLSPEFSRASLRGYIFLFDAGRDDGDKNTAPHRPVAAAH